MTHPSNRVRLAALSARLAKARHASARAAALGVVTQLDRVQRLYDDFSVAEGETDGGELGAQTGFASRLFTAAGRLEIQRRVAAARLATAELGERRSENILEKVKSQELASGRMRARRSQGGRPREQKQ